MKKIEKTLKNSVKRKEVNRFLLYLLLFIIGMFFLNIPILQEVLYYFLDIIISSETNYFRYLFIRNLFILIIGIYSFVIAILIYVKFIYNKKS